MPALVFILILIWMWTLLFIVCEEALPCNPWPPIIFTLNIFLTMWLLISFGSWIEDKFVHTEKYEVFDLKAPDGTKRQVVILDGVTTDLTKLSSKYFDSEYLYITTHIHTHLALMWSFDSYEFSISAPKVETNETNKQK